jgi:RNA-dependent RNA polymerase
VTCLPVSPVYKDGGKEKRKEGNNKFTSSIRCYFVRTQSGWDRDDPYILHNKTMDEARKLFMHIHTAPTVGKYLARLGILLILFPRAYISRTLLLLE